MHTGKRYTPLEFFRWSLRDTITMLLVASVPTILFYLGHTYLAIPWQPIAVLGTALSFVVGFKNNASYGRIWEARQIYGSIINDSRSFGYSIRDILGKNNAVTQRIFYRHFAWLTALRFQLREKRTWENMGNVRNREYMKNKYHVAEWNSDLETELKKLLSESDYEYIISKKNRATQLTALQSEEIAQLRNSGIINDFQWNLLQNSLLKFTDDQGRAERIKNFPYPRNFASITTYLMFIFVLLFPFGLLNEFNKLGNGTFLEGYTIWLNIPISAIVTWAFHVLDTIGESSVNPFEGSANDVPITQISRTIEIDMRDMLNETNLPPAIQPENNIVL